MSASLGFPVQLRAIESELKKLWESSTNDEASVVTRASLTNFAVYSESPNALEDNTEIIQQIMQDNACRALVINAIDAESGPPEAEAWITAHCHVGGKSSICSEQISFLLKGGHTASSVGNIVFAHLDSDLPLVCWWQGELSHSFEERFYSYFDRLIVNSASWSNPIQQFELLKQAEDSPYSRFILHDLTWSKSYQLRLAIASSFDDPMCRQQLPWISHVTIEHGSEDRLTAKMIAAWMAYALGWRVEKNDENRIEFAAGNRQITLEFREAGDVSISKVEVQSATATFKFEQSADSNLIHISDNLPGMHNCQVKPADSRRIAALVNDQLARAGSNRLYQAVRPVLLSMLSV